MRLNGLVCVALLWGFAYLAAILDKLSPKMVGYVMSLSITRELTLATLKWRFGSGGRLPDVFTIRIVACSTRHMSGMDYQREQKFEISMSAKGNPYDNTVAESFMKTYKNDEVYLSDYERFGRRFRTQGDSSRTCTMNGSTCHSGMCRRTNSRRIDPRNRGMS